MTNFIWWYMSELRPNKRLVKSIRLVKYFEGSFSFFRTFWNAIKIMEVLPIKMKHPRFLSVSIYFNHKYKGLDKAKRPKGEQRTLTCPFFECLKEFAETGNLKTHLRTHVISFRFNLSTNLDRRKAICL